MHVFTRDRKPKTAAVFLRSRWAEKYRPSPRLAAVSQLSNRDQMRRTLLV
jgi:hypothetical protein